MCYSVYRTDVLLEADMNYLETGQDMSLMDKLGILTDAAKYDVACTSSGVDRRGDGQILGNCVASGICHSFSSDGRCISLLKIALVEQFLIICTRREKIFQRFYLPMNVFMIVNIA